MPGTWPTDWFLVANLDQISGGEEIEISVEGIRLRLRSDDGRLSAEGEEGNYPVMVVDEEIYVYLGDVGD
jgi:hypothetical protein